MRASNADDFSTEKRPNTVVVLGRFSVPSEKEKRLSNYDCEVGVALSLVP
jgi:hypothetical protein